MEPAGMAFRFLGFFFEHLFPQQSESLEGSLVLRQAWMILQVVAGFLGFSVLGTGFTACGLGFRNQGFRV